MDEVEFSFRLSGRRWQKDAQAEVKFFLNAEVLDFQVVEGQGGSTPTQEANDAFAEAADDDEVPF